MKKLLNESMPITQNRGFIICISDIPADFIASNSKFSPRLPIVIIVARRIANGIPIGIIFIVAYIMSSIMTLGSRPLPTNSSIYRHTKFIIRIKMMIRKVSTSGPRKDFRTS